MNSDILGFYLNDALPRLQKKGFKNLNIVTTRPNKTAIPVNKPRVVRFNQISLDSGVVTIVYEEYLKGGGK